MNKKFLYAITIVVILALGGCGKKESLIKPYDISSQQSEFSFLTTAEEYRATSFAADLAVVTGNILPPEAVLTAEAAAIYCLDNKEVLYAKNVYQQMNPASITKVMTALLAIESGKLDDMVTITEASTITESGATLCGLKPGDKLTLRQLLNCSLVYSGNDVAAAIGIYLGQSEEGFCAMMNQRAKELGATGTNFQNAHGLTEEGHYTTAYDIYLILKEAMKYEEFLSIINQGSYELVYTDEEGKEKTVRFDSTNRFVNGRMEPPEGVTVIGGKTGTTKAAGSCLALISKSSSGKTYISVVLKTEGSDVLFQETSTLLSLEN